MEFPKTPEESLRLVLAVTKPFKITSDIIVRLCCPPKADSGFVETVNRELVERGFMIHIWPVYQYKVTAELEGRARPLAVIEAWLKEQFPEAKLWRPPQEAYDDPPKANFAVGQHGLPQVHSTEPYQDSESLFVAVETLSPIARAVMLAAMNILKANPDGHTKLSDVIWRELRAANHPLCPPRSTNIGPQLYSLRRRGALTRSKHLYKLTPRGRQIAEFIQNEENGLKPRDSTDWNPADFAEDCPTVTLRVFEEIAKIEREYGEIPRNAVKLVIQAFKLDTEDKLPLTDPGIRYHLKLLVHRNILRQDKKYTLTPRGRKLAEFLGP